MKATPLQPDCLRICPLGLDERGLQTLQAFFERHLAGSCQLAPEAEAHAVLIDGDNYHAKKFLAEQRESCPNRPIILLTLTPEKAEIANGIVDQIKSLQAVGMNINDVNNVVLFNQYLDVMRSLSESNNTKTVVLPASTPGGYQDLYEQVTKAMLTTNEAK